MTNKTLPPFCYRKDLTKDLREFQKQIKYSDKYCTESHEYRHVILPKKYFNILHVKFKNRLLSDEEWRYIGICQSEGWEHYLIHGPEPHVFLFKRPLGNLDKPLKRKAVWQEKSTKANAKILSQEKARRRSLRIASTSITNKENFYS